VFLLSADDVALSCSFILSPPNLPIPSFRSPLGIWKLTSDSPRSRERTFSDDRRFPLIPGEENRERIVVDEREYPRIPGEETRERIVVEERRYPRIPGEERYPRIPGEERYPRIPGEERYPRIPDAEATTRIRKEEVLRPERIRYIREVPTSRYGETISILPKPAAPTIAMPKSQLLPFRNLNVDGDGNPEGDESSGEESMELSDENIGPEEGAEQPALELPIRLDAESSASEDRTLNSLLELGSNQKQLLSLLAKSFKASPVGDYPRMA
jgi:hypothetical protein